MRGPVQQELLTLRAAEQAGYATSERGDPAEVVSNGLEAGRMGCSEQFTAIPRQANSPYDLAPNMAIVTKPQLGKGVT